MERRLQSKNWRELGKCVSDFHPCYSREIHLELKEEIINIRIIVIQLHGVGDLYGRGAFDVPLQARSRRLHPDLWDIPFWAFSSINPHW